MAKTPWKAKHSLLLIVATIITLFAGAAVYNDWEAEAPYREKKSRQQQIAAVQKRLWDARDRLQSDGAVIPHNKMCLPFEYTDLSGWKPTRYSISELSAFRELPKTPGITPSLKIRLGPAVDSEIIPILCELHRIEKLDINGAKLTDLEIDAVLASHPNCRLETLEVPDY